MKMIEAFDVKRRVMRYAFYERNHIAVVTEGLNNADVLGITGSREAVEFEIKVSRSDLQKELAAIRYAQITTIAGKNIAPAEPDSEQMGLNLELGRLKQKSGGWSKITKHEEYVDIEKWRAKQASRQWGMYLSHHYAPNVFYLVVPDKLVALAIEGTKGTGYGVIAYDGCRGGHYGYRVGDKWYTREQYDQLQGIRASWTKGLPCELAPGTCLKEMAVKQKAKKLHKDPVHESVILTMLQRAVSENITLMDEVKRLNGHTDTQRDPNPGL